MGTQRFGSAKREYLTVDPTTFGAQRLLHVAPSPYNVELDLSLFDVNPHGGRDMSFRSSLRQRSDVHSFVGEYFDYAPAVSAQFHPHPGHDIAVSRGTNQKNQSGRRRVAACWVWLARGTTCLGERRAGNAQEQ